MKKIFFYCITFIPVSVFAAGANSWVMGPSTIKYLAYHTFHDTVGETTAAKGKGVCESGNCEFLVAAEVKSFHSGDSNRDLHMIQAVKGAEFPIVSVKTTVPENSLGKDFTADLLVNFSGKEVTYPKVNFQVVESKSELLHIKGEIPLELDSHGVQRPSLLGVAIKNKAPVTVDIVWKRP